MFTPAQFVPSPSNPTLTQMVEQIIEHVDGKLAAGVLVIRTRKHIHMFTPAQFVPSPSNLPQMVEQIIEHVDGKLAAGVLVIRSTRAAWTTEAIRAAVERYRDAGWMVMVGGERDVVMTFQDPTAT